jgi:hypothetical protein
VVASMPASVIRKLGGLKKATERRIAERRQGSSNRRMLKMLFVLEIVATLILV